MGELSKFLGKPKEIEIKGEKITIYPLKVKDMQLFSKQEPTEEEIANMGKSIIKLSIKDVTDEEIDDLDMEVFVQLMEEINKLNGFKDERIGAIKERLAKAKKQ